MHCTGGKVKSMLRVYAVRAQWIPQELLPECISCTSRYTSSQPAAGGLALDSVDLTSSEPLGLGTKLDPLFILNFSVPTDNI